MRIGITAFLSDRSMRPDEFAQEIEARGFDAMYVPEHTHIPTSRLTPAPMGEPLPEQYHRILDPFVALTAAAMATKRIRIGTAVCLMVERDPFVTAKEVATLDWLSGGRFVFGVGFGWNKEEMADHGVDYSERREVSRERVLAMKRLWEDEEASFQGDHVWFDSSWAWPKPVQHPHPPILLGGGAGPKLFAHIAEYGDGWMPIGGKGVGVALPDLRRAYEERGRDPSTIQVSATGSIPDPGKLAYFQSIGITEVILGVSYGPREVVLPELDRFAGLVTEWRGT
jgi:probable F420-dependent oxidoreductase